MRVTTSLLVRNFLSKLHPPPAASPTQREAKQLLNILETSFRKRLDDAHPAPQALSRTERFANNGPVESSHGASNAASLHLDSVLQHPLLVDRVAGVDSKTGRLTLAVSRFEQALVEGSIDHEILRSIARAYLKGIKEGQRLTNGRALGPKIESWFSNEAGSVKQAFLTNYEVLVDVLPVMYADGMEEVVWDWLRILYGRGWCSASDLMDEITFRNPEMLKAEDNLVSLMMRAAIRRGSLSDAAQQYVQACEYRAASGRGAVEFDKAVTQQDFHPLIHSWKRLAISILYRRKRHGLVADLYDDMLKYSVPFFYQASASKAFLETYHPDSPSAKSLYQEFQSPTFVERYLSWQNALPETFHKAFLVAILDAAQLSLDQNHSPHAKFLLEFAEKHYPKFISMKTESNTADRLELARQEIEPRLITDFQVAT